MNITQEQLKKDLPDLKPGQVVVVHQKIKEGNKERVQPFEGLIIAKKHGDGINGTITVRKIFGDIAAERVFPIHSPSIQKIEVIRGTKVRRSKLYYLRGRFGKQAKMKNKAMAAIEPEVA
ncbi:MAG: 50S ribosomal protein L19 [Candidatus Portnoybacteria bacterium]|nr:50S ribosomal protein L19 [Candidatus Portnoybacteria bacterium]